MLNTDKTSNTSREAARAPKHQHVLEAIQQAIDSGELAAGDRLPDERQMARTFNVSRNTIRQALAQLHTAGKVQRRQGSGTFVAGDPMHAKPTFNLGAHASPASPGHEQAIVKPSQATRNTSRQMISFIVVGPFAGFSSYINAILVSTQQILGEKEMNLVINYVQQSQDLPKAIHDASSDPSTIGGLVLGDIHEAEAAMLVDDCIPWVVVGDFLDASRTGPVIDQVTGDNYHLAQFSTRALLEKHVKCPALFITTPGIWQEEKISAFRTTCQAAGIDPANQFIGTLLPDDFKHHDVNAYNQAIRSRTSQIIRQWQKLGQWPDGILLPGQSLQAWVAQLRAEPGAWPKLKDCPIVAMEPEMPSHRLVGSLDLPGLMWSEIATADIAAQAIYRLLVNPRLGRSAVRDYIRKVRIVPNQ